MNALGGSRRLVVIGVMAAVNIGVRAAQAQPAPEPKATPAVSVGADYSETVVRVLAERSAGDAVVHGATIRTGSRTLGVRAVVDKVISKDGKVVVGLDVQCKVDGAPADALYSGSLGIEGTPEAAARVSVEEWVGQYGIAILDAFREKSDRGFQSGRFVVFPGLLGIRGDAPATIKEGASIIKLHRRFLQKLDTSLPALISSDAVRLHALNLTLVLRKGVPTQGECRVDGQVSEELCRIAKEFDWPAPTTTYMLKQYYVLNRDSGLPKPGAGTTKR
jgi:hypothetical protein